MPKKSRMLGFHGNPGFSFSNGPLCFWYSYYQVGRFFSPNCLFFIEKQNISNLHLKVLRKPQIFDQKAESFIVKWKKSSKKACPNGKKNCYLANVICYLQGSHNSVPLIQAVIIKPRKANMKKEKSIQRPVALLYYATQPCCYLLK